MVAMRMTTGRGHGARVVAALVGSLLVYAPGQVSGGPLESIPPAGPADVNCDGERKHDDLSALVVSLFRGPAPECTGGDVNADGARSAADVPTLVPTVVADTTRSIAVLAMGDGMGPEHVRAGAAHAGGDLGFNAFPVQVMIDTSSLTTLETGEPTDSAAGATAFATGERVFNGEVSRRGDRNLLTLGELAMGAGKSLGIVTNSYLFDASPAAFATHTVRRNRLNEIADQYLALAPDVLIGAVPRNFRGLDAFIARSEARGYTVVRSRWSSACSFPSTARRVSCARLTRPTRRWRARPPSQSRSWPAIRSAFSFSSRTRTSTPCRTRALPPH